ncbi:hypothetical protein [Pseudoxanthomonas beigongshangi]|uniref:hypothetical protein n=1 Tax=Pseudoxanthomonas beigongshangi TaxID=2782537 RepID=UPI00193B4C24|nr:hypothetical protein [Pseudoxanthomonas beigongshangi]
MTARNKTTPRAKAPEPNLRHVWLAGLGAVAIARRRGAQRLTAAKQDIERIARQAQATLREARAQGEAGVEKFSADVEARLAPVLEKLGLASARPAAKTRRKSATGKPARPAARKRTGAGKATTRKRARA